MPIPLIPFVAGAVLGGLGVALYRDQKLRAAVKRTAQDLPDRARQAADDVSSSVSGAFRDLRGGGASSTQTAAKKTAAKKSTAKKGAAKKAAVKKAGVKKSGSKKASAKKASAKKAAAQQPAAKEGPPPGGES
ncbi:MAG: hypothetical protein RIB45_02195 [Marivibrio sp.]|uniref:hypothetical protein n=1 Tax=Marivibrio sp. TaxID=2039719 RepID=UPI0032EF3B0B